MKKILFALSALSILAIASCKKDPKEPETPTEDPNGYTLSTDITTNRTLLAGKTYTMSNMVYVKNGATLTIEAGAIIKVSKGKNALVITRGSKIMAEGTATSPIVFTSAEGTPSYGDWGGIVMLGKASTNSAFNGTPGTGEIEGGVNNSTGDGLYGGSDDNDNSGKLKYVRIEYGGYPFQPDKELNSLTMGGVGRGTEIDYVECAYGYDDAFEWFGGTVNAKHLISYKTIDDDFDCDNGFRGTVQWAIAVRDKDRADISGSNSFEQDNDASGSATTPQTSPIFANVTIIGPRQDAGTTIHKDFKRAAHLRRNSATNIYNSILMGYPTGILIDGSKTIANLQGGTMELKGIILAGMGKALDTAGAASSNFTREMLTDIFNTSGWNNEIKDNTSDAGLANPYGAGTAFDPTPSGSAIAAGGGVAPKGGTATTTVYRGAVAPGDTWWKGWSRF